MELKIYRDKEEVARAFADYFTELAQGRDDFHVALSGGSTPKTVFDILAREYSDTLAWDKIHLYWGDERCVPPTDDQSNYRMTVEHLISKIDIPPSNVNRILGENEPHGEAKRYSGVLERNLDRVGDTPRFDLIILGMGDDGHTASIFPHQIDLWEAPDHCVVATHPESGQKRVSLNGKVINAAAEVTFLVTGESKSEKVKAIVEGIQGSEAYPASLVDPESGKLSWFLDREAASGLIPGP